MENKKILLSLSLVLLLASCGPTSTSIPTTSINQTSTETGTTETSSIPTEITTNSSTSELDPTINSTSKESTSLTIETTTAPSIEEEIDEIPASGETLNIGNGNKTVSGPSNVKNPINITEWVNFDFYNSIPEYWSYIQGNNKVNNHGDFYAESAGGGFKFSQLYYGLQTPLLTPFIKTEVRLSISKVANNSQKKDIDEPIFHIYGYDITGHVIHTQYIEQGSITAQSEGKEIKFYIKNENVVYFELRLNAFPYKGSQCYNFGVDEISIKGWQYE